MSSGSEDESASGSSCDGSLVPLYTIAFVFDHNPPETWYNAEKGKRSTFPVRLICAVGSDATGPMEPGGTVETMVMRIRYSLEYETGDPVADDDVLTVKPPHKTLVMYHNTRPDGRWMWSGEVVANLRIEQVSAKHKHRRFVVVAEAIYEKTAEGLGPFATARSTPVLVRSRLSKALRAGKAKLEAALGPARRLELDGSDTLSAAKRRRSENDGVSDSAAPTSSADPRDSLLVPWVMKSLRLLGDLSWPIVGYEQQEEGLDTPPTRVPIRRCPVCHAASYLGEGRHAADCVVAAHIEAARRILGAQAMHHGAAQNEGPAVGGGPGGAAGEVVAEAHDAGVVKAGAGAGSSGT